MMMVCDTCVSECVYQNNTAAAAEAKEQNGKKVILNNVKHSAKQRAEDRESVHTHTQHTHRVEVSEGKRELKSDTRQFFII